MINARVGVLILVIILLCACSDDEPEANVDAGVHADIGAEADAAEDIGGAHEEDVGPPIDEVDLTGVWSKLTAASALTDTVVAGEEEATTFSLLRVEVEHQGEEITLATEVCAVDIVTESDLAETIVPDAFVESLAPGVRDGSFADGVFELPRHYEVRGVEFADGEDPQTEPLPTDAEDPRVFDQDGDGNPGLTIFVDAGLVSGEIYVVQRGWDELEATVTEDDRIAGELRWGDEQEILGASDDTLLLAEPTSRPNPDGDASTFEMLRLADGESDDCSTLIDRSVADFSVTFP